MISTCLLIAAMISAAEGNPISARAELDASEIPFHHVAHYRVTVEGPAGAEMVVEPWGDVLPGLEVAVAEPVETLLDGGRKSVVVEFLLTPSVVNRYTLPETRVLAGGKVATALEARELVVRDLTPEERAEAAVAAELLTLDELGATGAPSWLFPLLSILGIGMALAGIWAVFVLLRRRGFFNRGRSPRDVAEGALAALDARLAAGEVSCDDFFLELSHILRAYLCAGFDPAVAGQSTPEFLDETLPALPVPSSQVDEVRDLLRGFDRVLFAQHSQDRDGQARDLRAVRDLIGSLEQETETRAAQALQGAA